MRRRWMVLAWGLALGGCFDEGDPVDDGPATAAADTAPATDGGASSTAASEGADDGDSDTAASDDGGSTAADGSTDASDASGGPLQDSYANCTSDVDCRPDETCIAGTKTCGAICDADPDCPPPPNGTATPSCLTPVVNRCRLQCEQTADCPVGMQCYTAADQSICAWADPG